MGGLLSTRWGGYVKRRTVEQCICMEIRVHARLVSEGCPSWCTVYWSDGRQVPLAQRDYPLEPSFETDLTFQLVYRFEPEGAWVTHRLHLVQIPHGRWLWRCPGLPEAGACPRRCDNLYLPPGATAFACRRCHDLTWKASQTSHQFNALAKALGLPLSEVRWMMRRPSDVPRRRGPDCLHEQLLQAHILQATDS
jgi:hypothetical protein